MGKEEDKISVEYMTDLAMLVEKNKRTKKKKAYVVNFQRDPVSGERVIIRGTDLGRTTNLTAIRHRMIEGEEFVDEAFGTLPHTSILIVD